MSEPLPDLSAILKIDAPAVGVVVVEIVAMLG